MENILDQIKKISVSLLIFGEIFPENLKDVSITSSITSRNSEVVCPYIYQRLYFVNISLESQEMNDYYLSDFQFEANSYNQPFGTRIYLQKEEISN